MGTQGYFGFRYKKKYYMIYNHFDSDELGNVLLEEIKEMIRNNQFDEWLTLFLKLKFVTDEDEPTDGDIEKCKEHYDDTYGGPYIYYNLLRKCQGSFKKVLKSGYALLVNGTLENDLFIEYCYVLDFDEKQFYAGHNNIISSYNFNEIVRL
jgi:hypothetical protein